MNIDFNKYLNLSKLSKDDQLLVTGAITDLVLARLADMVAEHLSETEIVELEKISATGDGDQMLGWLNQHIPNFAQGVEEVLQEETQIIAQQVFALTSVVVEAKTNG